MNIADAKIGETVKVNYDLSITDKFCTVVSTMNYMKGKEYKIQELRTYKSEILLNGYWFRIEDVSYTNDNIYANVPIIQTPQLFDYNQLILE